VLSYVLENSENSFMTDSMVHGDLIVIANVYYVTDNVIKY